MATATGHPTTSPLARPVTALWGVGPERARQLERVGILKVEDLLLHRPRRYEDRRRLISMAELEVGVPASVRGRIIAAGIQRWKKGTRSLFECILEDGTARLHCRWWQAQPWMEDYFAVGREFLVFGKPESVRPRIIDHPETELIEGGEEEFIHLNRLAPIYPLTEGLPQRWLRGLIWRTLDQFESQIREPNPIAHGSGARTASSASPDTLHFAPGTFPGRANAIRMLHFPETLDDADIARRRLALDEFIELQRQIQRRRKIFQAKSTALPCGGDNRLMKPFLAALGFKLTDAQTKVLREIRTDMRGAHPMRRLLQGDVGSGKTVVAACSALMVLESGFNVAVMAPTEILAEQHYRNFRKWFEPLGIGVELQTGSRKTAKDEARSTEKEPLFTSHPAPRTSHLFIGTHALIESGFTIPRLGLAIIDEQHKFGVTQREELLRKGRYPHLLVMTATPIPRTLGLTVYGELDLSTIDELPPGRGRIQTFVRSGDKLSKVWSFVRKQLAAGRQAYVVYPRVEETDNGSTKAVTKEFQTLQQTVAPFRVGLLHGRLRGSEKEEVMRGFRSNVLHVLLATSLVEVGVDVPNATLMVVENAEQFGLAQLHQLRGRIGRGTHDSYFILISERKNKESLQRLSILEETLDGFRIAEADLKLRGPGELLGQQQSGLPNFRFGNLAKDWDLIQLARQIAAETAI